MAGRFQVEAIFKSLDRMTAPIAKMQKGIDRFAKAAERGIKDLDKASDRWFSGLTKGSLGAVAALTAASAALAAASKPGMDFEQQMADLGAAYLKTRGEIGDLEKKALELGAATKFSATEIAHAMEEMAKAGFEPEQALAGIEGMTYAAAAAGDDLATTAANVAAVMKGMGIDISRSGEVADLLALASVKTASSISSLAESMSKVSSTARQLGVPLKDTVAMVALLQDVGLDASEAGSATATMLTMMSKPSKEAAAQMKKLGVSFKDAAGNMKSPVEVLGQLVKAGEKAGGNMNQVAFFADLVGLRGQKAAVNLKELFAAGKYDALVKALDESAGKAKQMADLRMDTMTGDLDVFTENVKGLAIELYSMESGGLRAVVQGMTKWIEQNGSLITSGIADFLATIARNFETIVTWGRRIATIIAVITTAAAAVKLWAGAIGFWQGLVALSSVAFAGWAIAIVAGISLVLAFWPEISAFFSSMWNGMLNIASNIASAVGSFVSAAFEPIKSFFVAWFEFVTGIWTLVAMGLITILKPGFEVLVGIAKWAYEVLLDVWSPVLAFYGMLWDGIVAGAEFSWGLISGVIGGYADIVKAVWGTLAGFFVNLWEGIKTAFELVLGPVLDSITWAVDKVRSLGRDTLGANDESVQSSSGAQVMSPQERVARSISETTTTSTGELTIRDETGKATMTKKPKPGGIGISLRPSGAF